MRFFARVLWGIFIVTLCVATLGAGVWRYQAASGDAPEKRAARPSVERIFTVRTIEATSETMRPVLTAYGTIMAGRVLQLRSASSGRIIDLANTFREGAEVESGAVLARIDPADQQSQKADTLASLADARSRESEARQAVRLAEAERNAADQQVVIRSAALRRQKVLANQGIVSKAAVENAEISLATAQQTAAGRQQALVSARERVDQALVSIERAEIAIDSARRGLEDTTITAPFSGVLSGATATLGRLVTQNEQIAELIDLTSLEASFRVSDQQYARLLSDDGRLASLSATVTLDLGEREITAPALIDRAAATVGAEGGRLIYARLAVSGDTPLRPGDFVRVDVEERPLVDVTRVPATAVDEVGRLFVIGEDDRLVAVEVDILRRLSDTVIVRGAPLGKDIVINRQPQFGAGIKVRRFGEAAPEKPGKPESPAS